MNLILKFSTEKNRSFICRLPGGAGVPFNFQPRVQDEGDSISVLEVMMTNGVGPLVFYDGRLDSPTFIKIIKNHLLSYI